MHADVAIQGNHVRKCYHIFNKNTFSFTKRSPGPIEADKTVNGGFGYRIPMPAHGLYTALHSIADNEPFDNIQHHWLHDALTISVLTAKFRHDLTGIPFERIKSGAVHES